MLIPPQLLKAVTELPGHFENLLESLDEISVGIKTINTKLDRLHDAVYLSKGVVVPNKES